MPTYYEQFRDELDHAEVTGRSPRRTVTVRRDCDQNIEVEIEPGTLRSLTHRQLTDEVRGALEAALADFSAASDRVAARWFGGAS